MNRKNALAFGRTMLDVTSGMHIPTAAAALSYYLTLSLFPLLLCLNFMLGGLFPGGPEFAEFLSGLLPSEVISGLLNYLSYLAQNRSTGMLSAALILLLSSSSAGVRAVSRVMLQMSGRRMKFDLLSFVNSFAFSLFFLAAFYLSVLIILTGRWFLNLTDQYLMFVNISDYWRVGRFFLLFLLLFLMLCGVYRLTASGEEKRILPGAVLGAGALVTVSMIFSKLFDTNSGYPLVYGSIAGIAIVMLWFYTCGIILFWGFALNLAVQRRSMEKRIQNRG